MVVTSMINIKLANIFCNYYYLLRMDVPDKLPNPGFDSLANASKTTKTNEKLTITL